MLMVAVESAAGGACPSSLTRRAPQCEQKRASSGFALPQLVQYGIGDRLLSNPQGRVEVDGSPNLPGTATTSGPLQGPPLTHSPSVSWYAAASISPSTEPASAGTTS